ncbi:MAG: VOC family protein [Bacteroidales bacterium]|jgi:catechol 2,3-dioxygenase-like lactoylglutathione lyase family enzyme|nr:VOC family protein [Bacteroidales bacterium]
MEDYIISGIQQVGIGVPDVYQAWDWYRDFFGVGVKIFDEQAVADIMAPYMGGVERQRHAILALNLQGGGGFEIWQHLSRSPQSSDFEILPGDLGIFACKIKAQNIPLLHRIYTKKNAQISPLFKDERNKDTFFMRDPYHNVFQLVSVSQCYIAQNKVTGGVWGVMIGVSDMEKSLAFYKQILGYDTIIADREGIFEDFAHFGMSQNRFRRVVLTHSRERMGAFSQILGNSEIELVQSIDRTNIHKIFDGRMWGDIGFIQLCMDIKNMSALEKHCQSVGYPFTVDSRKKENQFAMGDASGHFAYNEDPDGTLIEYVETERIKLLKKPSLYLNLKNRNPYKPLPKYLLKLLKLTEKK